MHKLETRKPALGWLWEGDKINTTVADCTTAEGGLDIGWQMKIPSKSQAETQERSRKTSKNNEVWFGSDLHKAFACYHNCCIFTRATSLLCLGGPPLYPSTALVSYNRSIPSSTMAA